MNPNIAGQLFSLAIFAVIQFAFPALTAAYIWFAYLWLGMGYIVLYGDLEEHLRIFRKESTIYSKVFGWATTLGIIACIWTTTPYGLAYTVALGLSELLIRLPKG